MSELKIFSQNNKIENVGIEDSRAPTSVVQLKELLHNYEGIVES